MAPRSPPVQQLQMLARFSDVYVLVSDLDKCFRRVALPEAQVGIVLAEAHSVEQTLGPHVVPERTSSGV